MSDLEMTTKVTMQVGPNILCKATQSPKMTQLITKHAVYGVFRCQILHI